MLKLSLLMLLIVSLNGYGQTKAIAFKSHSGNPAYFTYKGEGNFGLSEPMPRLDSIVKINDTTVVQFYNSMLGPYSYDTMQNHPFWCHPNLNVDSLKKQNYQDVEFIGFIAKKKSKNQVQVVKPLSKRRKRNKNTHALTLVRASR
ncbi:MAG: hypothetical protein GQ574_08945 [Crocinitomix sp.]|nr:hypothetical protein [Crocinitomix sp.]